MDPRSIDRIRDKSLDSIKLPTRDIELFRGLSAVEQSRLLGNMDKISLEPGTAVFAFGDEGDCMYIIIEGSIELYSAAENSDKHTVAVLGSGEIFGEMSLLTGEPRSASAVALTGTELYVIDYNTFSQMTSENSNIAQYFMRLLSHRLTQTNERLRNSLEDNVKLTLEDLNQLSPLIRNIILATSLLPDWPELFLESYFSCPNLPEQIAGYLETCRHIFRWDEEKQQAYLNPACKSVLRDIFIREKLEQKEAFLNQAVDHYTAQGRSDLAMQVYTDNADWPNACQFLIALRQAEWDSNWVEMALLLENCPDDVLFQSYIVFTIFLDACLENRQRIGWNRLQIALANWRNHFDTDEAIGLYEKAAEYCNRTGDTEKAQEYRNLALSLYPALGMVAGKEKDFTEGSDRIYQLTKQQLNSAWRIDTAEQATRAIAGKIGLVGLIAALLAVGSIWFFATATPAFGLTRQGMLFTGISLAAVIFWIVNLMPSYIVALLMAMAWVVSGLVQAETALSGFASPLWIYLLCILGLGAAISKSGLLYRLSLYALRAFPNNYRGQLMGIVTSGLLVNPLIPSSTAKVALATPLAQSIARAMRFDDNSNGSAGLTLAALIFYGYTVPFTLTGTYSNLLGLGLIPSANQFGWLKWFVYALPAMAVFSIIMLIAILLIFKPEKNSRPLSPETLEEQVAILGALTREEITTIVVALGSILMLILQPWHGIDSAWVMLTGFSLLVLSGVLDTNSLKNGIDWPFLLFIGVAFSLTAVASQLGVVKPLTSILAGYMGPFMSSPYLFVLAVVVAGFLVTLVIRDDPAVILLVVALLPLAQQAGIHPWIMVFTILLTSDSFFFSYQSPTYLTAYFSTEGKAFSHVQGQRIALCYGLAVVMSLLISVPFWQWAGLIR
ncbi:MAG: cyclic nucleotide-binding domain-containing protein [Syntrophomonadaceae bacterium]|nr:cyclic nucleotide-binding domain-containing protein [Syntrophomonadaceae bacterium]